MDCSLAWLTLITAIGEGQRISTNHMLNKLPQVKLIRSDIYLDKNAGIDDGGAENLEYLTAKGIEMWNANKSEIDTLIKNIVNNQQLRGDNKVRKIV